MQPCAATFRTELARPWNLKETVRRATCTLRRPSSPAMYEMGTPYTEITLRAAWTAMDLSGAMMEDNSQVPWRVAISSMLRWSTNCTTLETLKKFPVLRSAAASSRCRLSPLLIAPRLLPIRLSALNMTLNSRNSLPRWKFITLTTQIALIWRLIITALTPSSPSRSKLLIKISSVKVNAGLPLKVSSQKRDFSLRTVCLVGVFVLLSRTRMMSLHYFGRGRAMKIWLMMGRGCCIWRSVSNTRLNSLMSLNLLLYLTEGILHTRGVTISFWKGGGDK